MAESWRYETMVRLLIIALIAAGCGKENNGAAPDTGQDVVPLLRPTGISDTAWITYQAFSPEDVPPPTDETNAFADNLDAVRFGQFVFFEEALSSNGEVSCASCHDPELGFAGATPLAEEGVLGPDQPTGRHTPGLVNIAYESWYFWDGRADTLWGQATVPLENPVEMAGSRLGLAHWVYDTPDVKQAYESIFGPLPSIDPFPAEGRPVADPQTQLEQDQAAAWASMTDEGRDHVDRILANVMKAVAAYEMQLVSFESPFDRWVDQLRNAPTSPESWDAVGQDAQDGARLFVEVVGCVECHQGPTLSNGKFHNLGLPERDWVDSLDQGRYPGLAEAKASTFSSSGRYSDAPEGQKAMLLTNIPQREGDRGAFRTQTLRNLPKTAPYMHGGQLDTLDAVLEFYNHQPEGLPLVGARSGDVRRLSLEDTHVIKIRAFLESLDGDALPAHLLSKPPTP